MALRGVPRPEPEPGTYLRLRQDLERAETGVRTILEKAPRALQKYDEVGRAGRAVLDALTRAVREHAEAEARWLRYKKERGDATR